MITQTLPNIIYTNVMSGTGGMSCQVTTKIVCTLSNLSAGSTATLTLRNRVNTSYSATSNIDFEVSTNEVDNIPSNNKATTVLAITGQEPPVTSYPVYRFFNKINGEHFFTIDENEKNTLIANSGTGKDWEYEGQKFKAYLWQSACSVSGTVPLYRFMNKQTYAHLFTSDEGEKNNIISTLSATWSYEGEKFCVYNTQVSGSIPVYRFRNKQSGVHLLTADEGEKATVLTLSNWEYEGVKFYVNP